MAGSFFLSLLSPSSLDVIVEAPGATLGRGTSLRTEPRMEAKCGNQFMRTMAPPGGSGLPTSRHPSWERAQLLLFEES